MDRKFWQERWEQNNIGFHLREANPLLVKHFERLKLKEHSRIFLPLCGKTRDIAWLLAQGYRVAGAELSKLAIEQLFHELGVVPEVVERGTITHYRGPGIDIFVGDIFDLSPELLGPVDAVYDRAALVALPEEMRRSYSAHLARITHHAPQLLITYEYDPSKMEGPPFSVSGSEVRKLYESQYHLAPLETVEVPGGMRGKIPAHENVWLLMTD